ncbi:malyl-CoA thiolesterase [Loktanella sp. 3ANDIMAR09]|uniref:HpcH/HpaI aldolase/citrate lyase family protein n=1 Tax=Loktanella sp. 3ANDIMAR09 TaxID=1225657 RepID=UPI0006F33129|nr:CoA ester lyase [Loktanella sp. 3ANDIMAR09]KQI69042.1 malyl-CoA thiolesterase [Loktanella sp. 3ANDIMAR09]
MRHRPTRSALYIPGSKPRALDKARDLPCDVILFDLEDAVSPDAKVAARDTLRAALEQGGYGARMTLVRINGFDTEWGQDDARAAAGMPCDGVLIPKVDSPADLDAVADVVGDVPLWAMMETPLGVLNAQTICAHPRLAGIVMGTNDLAKDLAAQTRDGMRTALQHCLLAARAAGITAIDGVFNAFKDDEGLQAECTDGRAMGFDGKSLIHPAQLDIANRVFGPSEADIDLARRQIAAFDAAAAAGQGVAVVDGRIVENLHIVTARATLAKAEAITALETT